MSCYFRHLKDIFEESEIVLTAANKRKIDQALHRIAGVEYKDCPNAWKRIKAELADCSKRERLIAKLREAAGTEKAG